MTRRIVHRTRGQGADPIVRLMSPSDLGEHLKPFVFLDLFEADMRGLAGSMPVHPHSGIATVTVFTDGDVTFDDPQAGHGKELAAGTLPTTQGFQLWVALPPDQEHAEPEAQYIAAEQMPSIGPARLIVGASKGTMSPVRAPGALTTGERLSKGELAIFEKSETPITLEGAEGVGATFVLGSAVPHPYPLHLGAYSVHTSAQALAAGERHIRELKHRMDAIGDRRTGSGSTPVYRG